MSTFTIKMRFEDMQMRIKDIQNDSEGLQMRGLDIQMCRYAIYVFMKDIDK